MVAVILSNSARQSQSRVSLKCLKNDSRRQGARMGNATGKFRSDFKEEEADVQRASFRLHA